MVLGQGAVVGKPSPVLKQLAECVRLTIDCVVQTEPAILHQGQSGRGDHCLGEAPPRNDAFAAVLGCSHAVPADGVQASVLF
jgi:hypothetical protein